MQIKFVAQLISNSGVVAKDMGGQPFTLATERQMVAIPEAVKAKSREMYGEIPVQYVGIFTNISLPDYNNVKKDWGNVERQGFDFLHLSGSNVFSLFQYVETYSSFVEKQTNSRK